MAYPNFGIGNLRQFQAGLREDAADIDDIVGRVARRIGVDVLRRVVLATPIDTGRARGNWQVDLEAIPQGELDRLDKGGATVINVGMGVISSAKPYQQITIVNNVPYIGKLNDGHSRQAPAGFVENAIDAATRFSE